MKHIGVRELNVLELYWTGAFCKLYGSLISMFCTCYTQTVIILRLFHVNFFLVVYAILYVLHTRSNEGYVVVVIGLSRDQIFIWIFYLNFRSFPHCV